MKKNDLPKLPKGLSWRKYASGNVGIQASFTYKGIFCREILPHVTNTKRDIAYASDLIGEIRAKISRDIFKYADYFPSSKMLEKFGEAKSKAILGDYIDQYILACQKKGQSPSTIAKKNRHKGFLSPILDTQIIDITPRFLRNYFSKVKVSVQTASIDFHLIKRALSIAIIDEVITANPCHEIDLTEIVDSKQKIHNTSDKADPFTLAESYQLIEASYEKLFSLGNMIQFWLNTGLRTQELFGLQWSSIDLKRRVMKVKHTMVAGELREIGKDKHAAKNKFAERELPINDAALEALTKQKPETFFKRGYVFLRQDGTPFTHATKFCNGTWKTLVKRAGIRYRRPYNCRHTFATMVISAKNDTNTWELIKWMGHSSVTMLEQHYASFDKEFEMLDSKVGISPTFKPELHVQNTCNS